MLSAKLEPAIPASELLQTPALDRAATGIGLKLTDALISKTGNEDWNLIELATSNA
jgi:hypothetical protein